MSETLSLSDPALRFVQPAAAETASSQLTAERQVFVDSMVQEDLISEEFSHSGALDAFSLDETLGRDALPHILVGDNYGGGHHL